MAHDPQTKQLSHLLQSLQLLPPDSPPWQLQYKPGLQGASARRKLLYPGKFYTWTGTTPDQMLPHLLDYGLLEERDAGIHARNIDVDLSERVLVGWV